jgi:hypothetical protein
MAKLAATAFAPHDISRRLEPARAARNRPAHRGSSACRHTDPNLIQGSPLPWGRNVWRDPRPVVVLEPFLPSWG